MSEAHLGALQLSAERITTMVDFYESYATLARRRADEGPDTESAQLDAASALRSAGQWAMILDPARGVNLLVSSAQLWDRLGHGFGTYLLAAFRPNALAQVRRIRQQQLVEVLAGRSRLTTLNKASPEFRVEDSSPLLHPQQQAYLLLAMAGPDTSMLEELAAMSPHRLGVVPIGALGMPLRVYWDIATHLMAGGRPVAAEPLQALEVIVGHLEAMAAAYATAINSAMANEYLWFNAASPVEVADVDVVAMAALAARRYGEGALRTALARRAARHDALTRVPLELAMEVVDYVVGDE